MNLQSLHTVHIALATVLVMLFITPLQAQDFSKMNPEDRPVDMDNPTFVPMVRVGKVLEGGDSIKYVELNNIYVYAPLEFKNDKQRRKYDRLVYNVKKVLPIAKEVNRMLIETYEYMETLPNEKVRREHIKLVEKGIKAQYTPRMKKLSLTQGKLLIKLIHRETSSSSYELVKAFLGTGRAMFYQSFAWMFGASLKKTWEPEGDDKVTERVVRLVEAGQL